MKRELQAEVEQKIKSAFNKIDLKAVAHSEELEPYNGKTLSISGTPEATYIDQNGQLTLRRLRLASIKSSNLEDSLQVK